MSRDTSRTHLHLHSPLHADLLEDFTRHSLLPDEIYLPQEFQPTNPEDEEDIVPDQHAAFGIRAATGAKKEAVWKDLGLGELLKGFQDGKHGDGLRGGGVGSLVGGGGAGAQSETIRGMGLGGSTNTGNGQAGDVLRRRQISRVGGNISMGSDLRS